MKLNIKNLVDFSNPNASKIVSDSTQQYISDTKKKVSSVRWLFEELDMFELGQSQFFSKVAIINHAERMHKDEVTSFTADWSIQYKYENAKNINKYYDEKF